MTESQHVEYKLSWRDEYLRWVCGFANADGGTLVIGRDDRGRAVGLADAARLLEELPNKIRDLLGIVVPVRLRTERGKRLVEIVVAPQPTPISYRGEYHVRSGTTKQQLSGAALSAFLLRKFGRRWDGAPYPGVTAADLDPDAFRRFRREARRSGRLDDASLAAPDAELVERLRLTEAGMLKRAALLLFHPEPDRFCTGAYVKVGKFLGAEVLHHDLVEGNLFKQLDVTLEVLKLKHLRARITYEGTVRVETFPVPDAALREALVNALVHKDYAAGSPVMIRVYDDRLAIMNAGYLPETWTLATLLGPHRSVPANPDVAYAFFRAGHIEAWGRGLDRIREACRAAGTPLPEVTYDGSGVIVEFRFPPEHVALGAGGASEAATPPVTPPVAPPVAPPVLTLLRTLADGPLGNTQLRARLGLRDRTHVRTHYVAPALAAGLVELTIPDKPSSRLQQYRLTAAGRAALAAETTSS